MRFTAVNCGTWQVLYFITLMLQTTMSWYKNSLRSWRHMHIFIIKWQNIRILISYKLDLQTFSPKIPQIWQIFSLHQENMWPENAPTVATCQNQHETSNFQVFINSAGLHISYRTVAGNSSSAFSFHTYYSCISNERSSTKGPSSVAKLWPARSISSKITETWA